MDTDFVTDPRAFAEANRKARLEYLRSLTPEKAARELEDLLNLLPEFQKSWKENGAPPPLPNPLPGPTLAILLEGKPAGED